MVVKNEAKFGVNFKILADHLPPPRWHSKTRPNNKDLVFVETSFGFEVVEYVPVNRSALDFFTLERIKIKEIVCDTARFEARMGGSDSSEGPNVYFGENITPDRNLCVRGV